MMVTLASTQWSQRAGHQSGYTPDVTDEAPYPNRLAERMKAAKMTDPRLAGLAGTTKQQIFKLRRGERKLTVEWAQRLAHHLGTEWFDLIVQQQPLADQPRAELLAAYDAMDSEQRRALVVVAKSMVPPERPSEPVAELAPRRRAAACIVPVARVRGR